MGLIIKHPFQSIKPAANDPSRIDGPKWNAQHTATGDLDFQQTGSSVQRPYAAKLAEWLTVKDFGAVGDGVADDTGAINAAITAADALSPDGVVFFPGGTYKIASAITVPNSVSLLGFSPDSTILKTSSATANIFTVTGSFQVIRGFKFDSSVTRTGGYYVEFTGGRALLEDFHMENALNGVNINITGTCTVRRGAVLNSIAATGVAIRISAGLDVTVDDLLVDSASQIFAGIYITNTGDVTINQCNIIHAGNALFLNPSAAQAITSVWANESFFDTSTRGLYLKADGGSIARCRFDGCWFSSAAAEGVRAEIVTGSIDGVEFNDCHAFLNAGNGFAVVSSGVKNFRINGGAAAQNTGDAVNIAANTTDFSIIGLRAGNTHGLTANANGIIIAAGTSNNYVIAGNDLRGNSGAPLTDGGTGESKHIFGNLGATANDFRANGAVFVGNAAYNGEIGVLQLALTGTTAKRLIFGYDDASLGGGYIQSIHSGVGLKTLFLQPNGSVGVRIGGTAAASNILDLTGSFGRANPVTKTADFTLAATENWLINNKAGSACVVTLPAASSFPGREVMFKTIQAQAINSNTTNVVPRAGGAATAAIVANVAGNWATIVSDGSNWILMQGTP